MRITALCLLSLAATTGQASLLRGGSKDQHRGLSSDDGECGPLDEATWNMTCEEILAMAAGDDVDKAEICAPTVDECTCSEGDETFAIPAYGAETCAGNLSCFKCYCALTEAVAALENNNISEDVVKLACIEIP